MTDLFAKTLLDAIEKLNKNISAAEARIISDQGIIDECQNKKETFQTLLAAYIEKKKADEEALATLYTSGKTYADFKTYSTLTGTELPAALATEDDAEPEADD
jgi:hypothetical protein